MAAWSQSAFLQALGWAMLNSFWQMALLFAGVVLLQQIFRLSAQKRYFLAVGSLCVGLFWFVYTFIVFYNNGASAAILLQHPLAPTSQTWNLILSSASLAYLFLLLVPAGRLARNWRYIEHLKKLGLQKTAMEYRLFVKKTAQHLGIKHTVHVYLSKLVQSPVTIGYLKPIILLPLAAVNNLSPQQIEAVLLHELSHIRRYDYLVNFIIMLLQTLFYFNPFVKKLVSLAEFEREKCCDEMVLQFQYDKVCYAAALLLLEKTVLASEGLVLAAAKKNHLLHRIEKILGLEKKGSFSIYRFAGALASILFVIFINSLLLVDKEIKPSNNSSFTPFENPLYSFEAPSVTETFSNTHILKPPALSATKQPLKSASNARKKQFFLTFQPTQPVVNNLIPVAYNIDAAVTPEEKAHIAQTVEKTKRILTKAKWKEVEASIADGMTAPEKKVAEYEYLKEINKIDWTTLKNRLQSNYLNLNWAAIGSKLDCALNDLKLDSLQTTYHRILTQIEKEEAQTNCKAAALPVPDLTVKEVKAIKGELQVKIDSINIIRYRKIVNF